VDRWNEALLSSQPDFAAQKNWIEETIEGAGHKVEFFPKFHCELNFGHKQKDPQETTVTTPLKVSKTRFLWH